jgi:hypothetical protein
MTRHRNRSLLVAAAGLMVALPVGWAAGEMPQPQDSARPVPYAARPLPCAKRSDIVRLLRETFGETALAQGLAHTGAVAEVFTSPKGTWTIVATSPNGVACMVGSGESWMPIVAHDGTI